MSDKRQGQQITLDEANRALEAARRSTEQATGEGLAAGYSTNAAHVTLDPDVIDPDNISQWFIGVTVAPPTWAPFGDSDGAYDFPNAMYWIRELKETSAAGQEQWKRPHFNLQQDIFDAHYAEYEEADSETIPPVTERLTAKFVAALNLAEMDYPSANSDSHTLPVGTVVRVFAIRSIDAMPRYYFSHSVGGGAVTSFHLRTHHDDYLRCSTLADDGTPNSDTIYIAKPFMLRRTPFDGQTRDGIDYGYNNAVSRWATRGGEQEIQIIIPSYVPYFDIIHATRASRTIRNLSGLEGANAVDTNWIEINQGRAWSRRRTQ